MPFEMSPKHLHNHNLAGCYNGAASTCCGLCAKCEPSIIFLELENQQKVPNHGTR